MSPARPLALLLATLAACTGRDPADSTSDGAPATGTASTTGEPATSEPTTGEPTTGEPTTGASFPGCPELNDVGITSYALSPGTFPLADDVDTTCTFTGGGTTEALTIAIDLECLDADSNPHAVSIALDLFYEPQLALFDLPPTPIHLLYHRRPLDFGETLSEVLALRSADDELVLLLAGGFGILGEAATAQFAAPLQLAEVDEALCPALGDCDTSRRTALDVTLADTTLRAVDNTAIEFPGQHVALHLGLARRVVLNTTGECASDAPAGLELRLVAYAGDPA